MKNSSSSAVPFQRAEGTHPADTQAAERPGTRIRRLIQRNMYRWHRTIGIIALVPVICWTLSGLSHPLMSNWFRPTIARERLTPQPVPRADLKLSLQEALRQHNIGTFRNFRIVTFGGHAYYQVKNNRGQLLYLDTRNGHLLPDGDRVYAQWLARYFTNDPHSRVRGITLVQEFDGEYKFVNRLLPVWKVSFERPDAMDVYVETEQSRLGTFNNQTRKTFIWIFDTFHDWGFLSGIGRDGFRITVMLVLLGIIITSALGGLIIYGFMWKKFRKPRSGDQPGLLRQYHRQIGIAVTLVTLTFAGSGAYHVSRKYTPDERLRYAHTPDFRTDELTLASDALPLDWERVGNVSLVKMAKKVYYQVFYLPSEEMPASIEYLSAETGELLPEGNARYARFLANKFMRMSSKEQITAADCCEAGGAAAEAGFELPNILQTMPVTRFAGEYGFVNKRLPVMKVSYDNAEETTCYVETATGRLAARVEAGDRREGLSFAVLHKFSLLEWAGKDVRDAVAMLSALGVLVTSLFGLALFIRIR